MKLSQLSSKRLWCGCVQHVYAVNREIDFHGTQFMMQCPGIGVVRPFSRGGKPAQHCTVYWLWRIGERDIHTADAKAASAQDLFDGGNENVGTRRNRPLIGIIPPEAEDAVSSRIDTCPAACPCRGRVGRHRGKKRAVEPVSAESLEVRKTVALDQRLENLSCKPVETNDQNLRAHPNSSA
jgi:hypothetical protein